MKMVIPRAWIFSILKSRIFTTQSRGLLHNSLSVDSNLLDPEIEHLYYPATRPPSLKRKRKKRRKKKPTLALSERGCVEMS